MPGLPFPLPCTTLKYTYNRHSNQPENTHSTYEQSKEVVQSCLYKIWLEHKVPDELPNFHALTRGFFEESKSLLDRFDNLKLVDTQDIDEIILKDGNRAPDISEAIELVISSKIEAWRNSANKSNVDSHNKNKNSKLNRNTSRITLKDSTEGLWWSEDNLLNSMKEACSLKSLELVYGLNNTRHFRNFISYNFFSDPHKESQQNLILSDTIGYPNMELVKSNSVILTCSFYHPVRGHKMAEFDILDTQTLADLRDVFICDEDYSLDGNKFKGSVFYIDGTLYPDTRFPYSLDYSKTLNKFFQESFPGALKSSQHFPQHQTFLHDLKIPIGTRCAFLHQGDCEHRIMFTSMRIFDPAYDCIYITSYPVRIFQPTVKMKSCEACNLTASFYLLFNSQLSPKNPIALCKNCCDLILNDEKSYLEDSNLFVLPYVDIL